MNRAVLGQAPARAAVACCVLWTVACMAAVGWYALRSPMVARKAGLDKRLSAVTFVPEVLPEPDKAPLRMQRKKIVEKETLWRPLVAPPAAAPAPEAMPDLLQKLKGVTVSLRDQIRVGDGVKVKARLSPEDKRGRWVTVGDTINGLTIAEIKPEVVVFSLEQNGKQYTTELPRR